MSDAFPPPLIYDFLNGKVAVVLVDELAADKKFVFYRGEAYRRIGTGDHKVTEALIAKQEEYQQEALQARELQPLKGLSASAFDLDKLNDYITQLNRPVKIETIKADLPSAMPFLERKCFLKEGTVTTLGMLVCGKHPADHLGFRCHVHGYVDAPQEVAQDKQDYIDNILPLMESSLGYLLRNIQVGVSIEKGGTSLPQYPEELLRETVNNALAHRDYSINRQVILAIKPGAHISICNPGSFRKHLLIETFEGQHSLRRILPEAKPRNPKLADVLRVYRKWEGRGIGMATLVNLCLENKIGLPYYRFGTEEATLYLCAGNLLDEPMERLFQSFDKYILEKLKGGELSEPQKLVLAYLIKSQWANQQVRYTILLTPDNNHFSELVRLEASGLISRHPSSTPTYPVYIVEDTFLRENYFPELRNIYGANFDTLDQLSKEILSILYRFNNFSTSPSVSAKLASFNIWYSQNRSGNIKEFDTFYRKIRRTFNKLETNAFIKKAENSKGYILSNDTAMNLFGRSE